MTQAKLMAMILLLCGLLLVPGMVFADSNLANVSQYGTGLKADVDQHGNINTATIKQGTSGSPITAGALVGYVSGAKIHQSGDNNKAATTWHTGNIGSRITQEGDRNAGSQNLSSPQEYKAGKYAIDIQQTGDDNVAAQTTTPSYGCYGIQDMLARQIGDLNTASQTSIGGRASAMKIVQVGNSNDSKQYQDGMYDTAIADIRGDVNITEQHQVSSVWGSATSHNSATVAIVGDTNNVSQNQLGVSNTQDIVITGDANIAIQRQTGDNNIARLIQTGDNNFASQKQTGNGNKSAVLQSGDFNQVTVVQTN